MPTKIEIDSTAVFKDWRVIGTTTKDGQSAAEVVVDLRVGMEADALAKMMPGTRAIADDLTPGDAVTISDKRDPGPFELTLANDAGLILVNLRPAWLVGAMRAKITDDACEVAVKARGALTHASAAALFTTVGLRVAVIAESAQLEIGDYVDAQGRASVVREVLFSKGAKAAMMEALDAGHVGMSEMEFAELCMAQATGRASAGKSGPVKVNVRLTDVQSAVAQARAES